MRIERVARRKNSRQVLPIATSNQLDGSGTPPLPPIRAANEPAPEPVQPPIVEQ